MTKEYIITKMSCDGKNKNYKCKFATSKEEAIKILKDWADFERKNTWICNYNKLDKFVFNDEYFDAQYDKLSTTIWISDEVYVKCEEEDLC